MKLEDKAEFFIPKGRAFAFIHEVDSLAVKPEEALVGFVKRAEDLEQSAFASSRCADECDDLAPTDGEVDALQNLQLPKMLLDATGLKHRGGRRLRRGVFRMGVLLHCGAKLRIFLIGEKGMIDRALARVEEKFVFLGKCSIWPMYLWEVDIKNVYGIEHFKIEFELGNEPGWHVLIGENGSGKTSILYCIAYALLVERMKPFLLGLPRLIRNGQNHGKIEITVPKKSHEKESKNPAIKHVMDFVRLDAHFGTNHDATEQTVILDKQSQDAIDDMLALGYGTYRDFRGGKEEFFAQGRILNFRTLFSPLQGLAHVSQWFKDRIIEIQANDLEKAKRSQALMETIFTIVNSSNILPEQFTMLREITVDGPMVSDPTGFQAPASDMSEGIRSILGLTLDILISMVDFYTPSRFLNALDKPTGSINLPAIILIDEVDAHLHPSWQTEIGAHLMKMFPKVQFIVTTHSPLICRAAERGTIWKLPKLGSGEVAQQVTDVDRDRLLFGNVLDAYGTELFGSEPVRNKKIDEKRSRLGKLKMRSALGVITDEERSEKQNLEMILATDDTFDL